MDNVALWHIRDTLKTIGVEHEVCFWLQNVFQSTALLPAFSKSGTAVLYIESLSCPLWMLSEGANVPELPITLSSAAVDTPLLCFSCHKLQQLLQAVAVWVGAGIQALLCFFWTFGFLNLACLFLSQIPPQGI